MRVECIWDGNTDNLDTELISDQITKNGYCHIRCSDSSASVLLDLANLIGPIQRHERSGEDGVAVVTSRPTERSQFDADLFQGLSDKALAPHSDGAYLEFMYYDENGILRWVNPPAIILLQCVQPAQEGGDSVLIDGAKMFGDIWFDNQMYEYVTSTLVQIYRTNYATLPVPFYRLCRNGNIVFRYRNQFIDLKNDKEQAEALANRLAKDYLANSLYSETISLGAGDILLIDNLRMLHARTAFSNPPRRYREFRRLWIADRWGHIVAPSDHIAGEDGAALGKILPFAQSDVKRVQAYRWLPAQAGQLRKRYPIRPSLGIRLPDR